MTRLRDVIIVIPGITGSVLKKDSKIVWGYSTSALWESLRGGLELTDDDPDRDVLDDGIEATALVSDLHMIPGLWKIDGYSGLCDEIVTTFGAYKGRNFFTFPYDWRRDNRVAARRLKRLVDDALPAWRKESNNPDAKVILLAHSMGGLVARHWLEVLGGRYDCRALVTFGTPYRGAPRALDCLANGVQCLPWLAETVRSFSSVYQLLPIYPAFRDRDGNWVRAAEYDHIPNVDSQRARDALQFHRDIERAIAENRELEGGCYRTVPIVGVGQDTVQSTVCSAALASVASIAPGGANRSGGEREHLNAIRASDVLPQAVEQHGYSGGDGTVPRVSAMPIEMPPGSDEFFIASRHATLQGNAAALTHILELIKQWQRNGLQMIRGADPAPSPRRPVLALSLDDYHAAGETIEMRAALRDFDSAEPLHISGRSAIPAAYIESVQGGFAKRCEFQFGDGDWVLRIDGLPPGGYRVSVFFDATSSAGIQPHRVCDVFAVGA